MPKTETTDFKYDIDMFEKKLQCQITICFELSHLKSSEQTKTSLFPKFRVLIDISENYFSSSYISFNAITYKVKTT